jgi:hypothetical protein
VEEYDKNMTILDDENDSLRTELAEKIDMLGIMTNENQELR